MKIKKKDCKSMQPFLNAPPVPTYRGDPLINPEVSSFLLLQLILVSSFKFKIQLKIKEPGYFGIHTF